jgi:hypothetical protein
MVKAKGLQALAGPRLSVNLNRVYGKHAIRSRAWAAAAGLHRRGAPWKTKALGAVLLLEAVGSLLGLGPSAGARGPVVSRARCLTLALQPRRVPVDRRAMLLGGELWAKRTVCGDSNVAAACGQEGQLGDAQQDRWDLACDGASLVCAACTQGVTVSRCG